MAGEAVHLGVLGPDRAASVASEPNHALLELGRLANAPDADAEKLVVDRQFGVGRLLDPVRGFDRAERVELKGQVRMARGQHFVVDLQTGCP